MFASDDRRTDHFERHDIHGTAIIRSLAIMATATATATVIGVGGRLGKPTFESNRFELQGKKLKCRGIGSP
jgi:hypothetical protein